MSGNASRLSAINAINNGTTKQTEMPESLSSIWASDVFNLATMEEALSKNAFKAMKKTVQTGSPLDPATADVVAAAMKDWAMSKGAQGSEGTGTLKFGTLKLTIPLLNPKIKASIIHYIDKRIYR